MQVMSDALCVVCTDVRKLFSVNSRTVLLFYLITEFCKAAIRPRHLSEHEKLIYKIEGFLGSKYNQYNSNWNVACHQYKLSLSGRLLELFLYFSWADSDGYCIMFRLTEAEKGLPFWKVAFNVRSAF